MKPNLQADLFRIIKDGMPPHLSLVEEIAGLLSVSTDSAYRRLRGETALTFDEAGILCKHFNIAIDSLILSGPGNVSFAYRTITEENLTFDNWLQGILADLQRIYDAPEREIIYSAKDLPVFHFFLFPEIARFKIFFWLKTIFDHPSLRDKKFTNTEIEGKTHVLRLKVLELYTRIPTRELWSDETINTTLQQIEYYEEAGLFESKGDAALLCGKMQELVAHIRKQAEAGSKFIPGREPLSGDANFFLYRNEVLIGDNTIFVRTGESKTVYITHNVLNYLVTSHEPFAERTEKSLENLMRKAELISGTNEKARNKYFNRIEARIGGLHHRLLEK